MLELGFDVAGDEGGGEKNYSKQHQADGDVPHERGRRPDLRCMRMILTETPDDHDEAGDRYEREQRAIAVQPKLRDSVRTRAAERYENVGAEHDDQADNEDAQTHAILATQMDRSQAPQ